MKKYLTQRLINIYILVSSKSRQCYRFIKSLRKISSWSFRTFWQFQRRIVPWPYSVTVLTPNEHCILDFSRYLGKSQIYSIIYAHSSWSVPLCPTYPNIRNRIKTPRLKRLVQTNEDKNEAQRRATRVAYDLWTGRRGGPEVQTSSLSRNWHSGVGRREPGPSPLIILARTKKQRDGSGKGLARRRNTRAFLCVYHASRQHVSFSWERVYVVGIRECIRCVR